MIIVLKPETTAQERRAITARVRRLGNGCIPVRGRERSVLAVLGQPAFDPRELGEMPGVVQVLRVTRSYKLASLEVKPERTVVRIGDVEIGGTRVVIMAGPCTVENRKVLMETALRCADAGVTILRGGAYKPRTSPYSFQGMGKQGLELLAEAREKTGLKVVTEVMTPENVELVAEYADILQIGARNMQNFDLLKECAQVRRPVLLKRGLSATIDEWLQSAEYILAAGKNADVILCERGIRTFETATRNTLDLAALPVLRERTHLPVVVDPSHATGVRAYVAPMARAAVAAGADGVMVEVHPRPETALCDGPQSLLPEQLDALLRDLQVIAPVVGRSLDLRSCLPALVASRGQRAAGAGKTGRAAGKTRAKATGVAFQGERGAFSEQAARQVFGDQEKRRPCASFRDVFRAVEEGRAALGIVPVENTLAGSIYQCYDLLLEHKVRIIGETRVRIVHNLIANAGVALKDVRRVYAHPQAAGQCERFLARHPRWKLYQVYDTAGSVKMIKEEGLSDGAAIAGGEAAAHFGMDVLAKGIESDPLNSTRFVVIAPPGPRLRRANKATLVYGTKNEPGALLHTLEIFRDAGINLTRLESRPLPGKPWEYLFHVDIAARPGRELLLRLRASTTRLKVLGVYPSA